MKLFSSSSLAEKQRLVEKDERSIQERQAQAQQQQAEIQQQEIERKAQIEQAKMQQEDMLNQRDNETKILIAQINASKNEDDGIVEPEYSQEAKDKLMQQMKEFDAKISLEKDKLEVQKRKNRADEDLKARQINKVRSTSK